MTDRPTVQLQYGINVHAEHVFKDYQPLHSTVNYPDSEATELRAALSKYTGVPAGMIVCGSGSDELVDLYIRMHKLRDDELCVAMAPPVYFQYPIYAKRVGARIVNLPHDRSLISPELLLEHGASPEHTIIMLDNPSNPAGDMVSREQIIALLDAGYRLFHDEAYYEFSHHTMLDLLPKYGDRLVISRTLSKIGGMAGSRVGYVIAQPDIIKDFNDQRLHFNVNIEGQHRALFVLEHMPEFEQAIATLQACKADTVTAFQRLKSYEIFPSLDLFFIFKHHRIPAAEMHQRLQNEFNIATFLFPDFKGHAVIRSAMGKPAAMQKLTEAAAAMA